MDPINTTQPSKGRNKFQASTVIKQFALDVVHTGLIPELLMHLFVSIIFKHSCIGRSLFDVVAMPMHHPKEKKEVPFFFIC